MNSWNSGAGACSTAKKQTELGKSSGAPRPKRTIAPWKTRFLHKWVNEVPGPFNKSPPTFKSAKTTRGDLLEGVCYINITIHLLLPLPSFGWGMPKNIVCFVVFNNQVIRILNLYIAVSYPKKRYWIIPKMT